MHTDNSNESLWASQLAVEREGFDIAPVLVAIFGCLAVIVLLVVLAIPWFRYEAADSHVRAAATAEYPDLRASEIHAQGKLNRYQLLDGESGVFQIPIEQAIGVLVQDNSTNTYLTTEVRY